MEEKGSDGRLGQGADYELSESLENTYILFTMLSYMLVTITNDRCKSKPLGANSVHLYCRDLFHSPL